MCIFMLVMMILMASGSDILGHLGGALYGFLFGMVVYPRPNSSSGKKMRYGPESGSDVDIAARVKAAIAILNDKPGSALKTQAAVAVLEGVLKVMA